MYIIYAYFVVSFVKFMSVTCMGNKNEFIRVFKNIARFENNFVGSSK